MRCFVFFFLRVNMQCFRHCRKGYPFPTDLLLLLVKSQQLYLCGSISKLSILSIGLCSVLSILYVTTLVNAYLWGKYCLAAQTN